MKVTEGIREAFDTVRHNKLRTALTMLSLVIGVASVIAVMAIGIMGRRAVMDDVAALGGALYWIEPERSENWGERGNQRQQYLRDYHVAGIHDLVRDDQLAHPGAARRRHGRLPQHRRRRATLRGGPRVRRDLVPTLCWRAVFWTRTTCG